MSVTIVNIRVSVQGVKSLGGHFACLCRGFEFYGNTFTLFIIFKVKSLQKEQNSTNLLLWAPICRNKSAITPKWFNSLDTNSINYTNISPKLLISPKICSFQEGLLGFLEMVEYSIIAHLPQNCLFYLKTAHFIPKITILSKYCSFPQNLFIHSKIAQ